MGLVRNFILLAGAIIAVFVGLKIKTLLEDVPAPVLRRDVWWGRGERLPEDPAVRGFKIEVPDAVITDLSARLDRFLKKPITPPLENIQFQYGFNTDYLRTVVKYWKDEYLPAWKERQKQLNSYSQFVTTVNGLKLHYIRVSPPAPEGKRVLPLLLLHGWPGSVREFYEIIPLLTRPNDKTDFIFEVIAPSLPGYGFSEGAAKPGMGPAEMAVVLNNLMAKLGFTKYYVQGGDWGAILAKHLGQFYPNTILGFHANLCMVPSTLALIVTAIGAQLPIIVVDKPQEHFMYPFFTHFTRLVEETGYYHLQATKPDTIGVALSDTPAGLAAYILEKFSTWANNKHKSLSDGGLPKKFSLEALLDNIMIYWVTNSITTSQRLYAEARTFRHEEMRLAEILGVHSNMCGVQSPMTQLYTAVGSYFPSLIVDPEHYHLMYPVGQKFAYLLVETGYMHLQATKPDTIGTVLGDTPAGLAGYILEKFVTWTNPEFMELNDGGLTRSFTLDALLDNIMIYWTTNSITTSQRLYSEAFTYNQLAHRTMGEVPLNVPSACARFHHDIMWQSEVILKLQYRNLVQVTDYPDGGHFAAFQLPKELAVDVISAVEKMEKLRQINKK